MNVLVLTPNRTGSTLLQRLLTIYMLRRGFDKPVININELTNGIQKHISPMLQQEVLGKSKDPDDWTYDQSLSDIVNLLKGANHYTVGRLAYWHLPRRNDPAGEHAKFVDYLNNNFYIISTQRDNLLEYALSWALRAHSKAIVVTSPVEKIEKFGHLYGKKVKIQKEAIFSKLNDYKKYHEWVSTYFDVQSYFNQEDLNNIENYILNLDFMQGAKNNTWKDMFGISWNEWNKTHKAIPDTILNQDKNGIEMTLSARLSQSDWDNIKGVDWPDEPVTDVESSNLPVAIQQEIKAMSGIPTIKINPNTAKFLRQTMPLYRDSLSQIDSLVTNNLIPTPVPIKLQTYTEKKSMIENFDECVKWYNEWVTENNFGALYDDISEEVEHNSKNEEMAFNDFSGYLTHQDS